MAEETYNYSAVARQRWPKADIDGAGPHVCVVMNFNGSLWVRLYQSWNEAQGVADRNGGRYVLLQKVAAPVIAHFNPSFGYRDKATA